MIYVLLLRGINVGGKNKVNMTDLKSILNGFGFLNVKSYINSGNLFFDSEFKHEKIVKILSEILKENYDFKINFSILSKYEFNNDYNNLPKWWNDDLARKDVLFFNIGLEKNDVKKYINQLELNNEIVHYGKNAIFWGKYDEENYLNTSYHKYLLKSPFYKEVTIRNGKTYNKIHDMINEEF